MGTVVEVENRVKRKVRWFRLMMGVTGLGGHLGVSREKRCVIIRDVGENAAAGYRDPV